jgi:hypothetical protein
MGMSETRSGDGRSSWYADGCSMFSYVGLGKGDMCFGEGRIDKVWTMKLGWSLGGCGCVEYLGYTPMS